MSGPYDRSIEQREVLTNLRHDIGGVTKMVEVATSALDGSVEPINDALGAIGTAEALEMKLNLIAALGRLQVAVDQHVQRDPRMEAAHTTTDG